MKIFLSTHEKKKALSSKNKILKHLQCEHKTQFGFEKMWKSDHTMPWSNVVERLCEEILEDHGTLKAKTQTCLKHWNPRVSSIENMQVNGFGGFPLVHK